MCSIQRSHDSFQSAFQDHVIRSSICDQLQQDGVPGNHHCLRALSQHFRVPVHVWSSKGEVQIFNNEGCLSDLPAHLVFNGFDHYDALLHRHSPVQANRQHFSFRSAEQHFTQAQEETNNPPQQDSRDQLVILSANVTSWECHADSLLLAGADILVLQETRLSQAGIHSQTKKLHFHKPSWRSVWGQAPNTIKIRGKPAHKASGKSKHGGVAILAKDPIALVPVGYDTFQGHALSETTRWTTAAVPLSPCGALSRRFLHIVSFYGIPNRHNGAEYTQNERLIELVFQHCNSLGPQPVLLCMDCNTSPEKSLQFQKSLATNQWFDVAECFQNTNPTFCANPNWDKITPGPGVSRPDYIVANSAALALCTNFTIRRDLSTKGHLGLQITIKRPHCMIPKKVYIPPTAFPIDQCKPLNESQQNSLFQSVFKEVSADFDQARNSRDMNKAWSIIGKTAEKYLSARCPQFKGQRGRHQEPNFRTEFVPSSGQHIGANVQPTTRKLAKLIKALRLLSELLHLQRRANIAPFSEPDEDVAAKLFRKISQAAKNFSINVESTWREGDLVVLKDRFETYIQSMITRERDRRICEWKIRLRQSFDIHRHGGAAFEWLKSTITPPIVAVKNDVGDIVTDPTEVIAVLQSSWQNLFNKNKLVPLPAFTNQYGDLLQPSECELPKITGQHLREKLRAAKNTRATALDGWRIPELKALPISFFDLVAQLFNLVEEGAPWPDLCCQAVISTIPKVANSEPADQPGGQQIAGEALNNRPITNLSPLYCAYSGARFKHMASWRESWMDPSMHGARQGHEVFDTSWNLALQLEHAAQLPTSMLLVYRSTERNFSISSNMTLGIQP